MRPLVIQRVYGSAEDGFRDHSRLGAVEYRVMLAEFLRGEMLVCQLKIIFFVAVPCGWPQHQQQEREQGRKQRPAGASTLESHQPSLESVDGVCAKWPHA